MSVYLDSSFVVSLYLTDTHSIDARHRVLAILPVALTPFHLAEWAHALAQQEFRGNLTPVKAHDVHAHFMSDRESGLWHEVDLPQNAFELCTHLARQYGPKIGIRTLDSLHVACAMELKAERFWTFDEKQAKLAKAQGLKIS